MRSIYYIYFLLSIVLPWATAREQFMVGKCSKSKVGQLHSHFSISAKFSLVYVSHFVHLLGSIFTSDKDEAEIAFRTAVDRANILERNIELMPVVVYANTEDSFIMEKTGKYQQVKILSIYINLNSTNLLQFAT